MLLQAGLSPFGQYLIFLQPKISSVTVLQIFTFSSRPLHFLYLIITLRLFQIFPSLVLKPTPHTLVLGYSSTPRLRQHPRFCSSYLLLQSKRLQTQRLKSEAIFFFFYVANLQFG